MMHAWVSTDKEQSSSIQYEITYIYIYSLKNNLKELGCSGQRGEYEGKQFYYTGNISPEMSMTVGGNTCPGSSYRYTVGYSGK